MTTDPTSTPATPATPKKKSGRWWKIVLIIAALVFLLILALPTLLSTSPGKSFILGQINSRIPGKAHLDSISLGWFSGVGGTGVQLDDPTGKPVLTVPSASTGFTLLNAVTSSSYNLGDVTVTGIKGNIVINPDGTNNLMQSLVAAGPGAPAPAGGGAAPAPAAPKALLVKANLHITLDQVTITAAGSPPLSIDKGKIEGNINTDSGPIDVSVDAQARSGNGAPATIAIKTNVDAYDHGIMKPVAQIMGKGTASITSLDLAALTPLLNAAKLQLSTAGMFNTNLAFSGSSDDASISGLTTIDQLALGGEMLKGDTLTSKSVKIPLDINRKGNLITIKSASLDSDFASLKATGDTTADALSAITAKAPVTLTDSALALSGTVDLKALVSQLPHVIVLQQGVQVTGGRAALDGHVNVKANALDVQLNTLLDQVAGSSNGRAIALEPLSVQLAATGLAGKVMPVATINMPADGQTLKLTAGPEAANAEVIDFAGAFNLDRLQAQATQFMDLGSKKVGGTATLNGKLGTAFATGAPFEVNLVASKLQLAGVLPNGVSYSDPNLTLVTAGNIKKSEAGTHVDASSLTLSSALAKFALTKPASVDQGAGLAADIQGFTLQTDLATISPMLVQMGYLPKTSSLKGMLNAGGSIVYGTVETKVNTTTSVAGFQSIGQAAPGVTTLPPTNITSTLALTANITDKTATVTGDSFVEERDPTTQLGNKVTLVQGTKLNWANQPMDATLLADYDLARISQLAGPWMQANTQLVGKRTSKIHVTGGLTADAGLASFKKLQIDPTSIGFDSIDSSGIKLGKLDEGFNMSKGVLTLQEQTPTANGGTVYVGGIVDFNQNPPAYILAKRAAAYPLAKNIQINNEVAAGWLKYLPLTWGSGSNDAAAVATTGSLNFDCSQAYIPLDSAAFKSKGTMDGTLNINKLQTSAPLFGQILAAIPAIPGLSKFGGNGNLLSGDITNVPVNLSNGKVTYDNFKLGSSSVSMVFSGSVGLDSSLAMNIAASLANFNVPVPIGLGGTISHPTPTVSPDFLIKSFTGDGKNIGGGLKDLGNNLGNLFGKKKKTDQPKQ